MRIRTLLTGLLLWTFWGCLPFAAGADPDDTTDTSAKEEKVLVKFTINEQIGPSAWRKTKQAFNLAREKADSIRYRLLNSKVPVYVLIDPNAASAGALISIACTKIYMTESATMGAATVVDQSGRKAPEKYQSYMRGTMRATAQSRGRDPKVAEAMVDENIDLEGIAPEGELLTFTRPEALEYDYCDGKAESIKEMLKKEGLQDYRMLEPEPSLIDMIITLLINPAVSSFLIMIMMGGIYFELQSPGLGFPIGAAIAAAVLYFAPLYLEDLAAHWEIALFIIGIILIAIEIFAVPGFGIPGLSGMIAIFGSLVLTLLNNDFFDFTFTRFDEVMQALLTVIGAMVGLVILILIFGKPLLQSDFFKKLTLQDTLGQWTKSPHQEIQPEKASKDAGDDSEKPAEEQQTIVGRIAKAYTDLGPSGKIWLDDNMYDAVSEGEFIEQGSEVKIIKDLKNRLLVRPKE